MDDRACWVGPSPSPVARPAGSSQVAGLTDKLSAVGPYAPTAACAWSLSGHGLVRQVISVELEDDVVGETHVAFACFRGAAHGHETTHCCRGADFPTGLSEVERD
jgi:hypothetical protein